MNKVIRYQIIKPMDATWKEFGDILYALQKDTREVMNKSIQLCWEYSGFSAEYKKVNEVYPKAKDILKYAGVDGYCYDQLKYEYNKFNSSNYTCTVIKATERWKNDLKEILRGNKSIASFRKDMPLDLHNKSLTLRKEDNSYYINLSLISNTYKKEIDRKSGQFLALLKEGDKYSKVILDRILSGEYKISASQLIHKNKKWFLNLCYGFQNIPQSLDKNNVMGIDMGIKYPIYFAIHNSKVRGSINGGEIEQFRKQVEVRRNQLLRQGKHCGEGRIGHGILTRIKPIDNIRNKISNFRDTINHRYSKYIIDEALKYNCGVIQMEDLTGVSKDDSFLKQWSYYDLQSKIEYKAKEVGIEVKKIVPKYTSQRCSECGYIDAGNRDKTINQSKFECLTCGFKTNADYNAARNIATPDIDRIIEDSLKI